MPDLSRHRTPTSRYRALAADLRDRIITGQLRAGDQLPTVNDLIKQHGVSRSTVVQAMHLLRNEGIISLEVGRGTFVKPRLAQGEIAVVLSDRLLMAEASPYYRLTASQIMSRITELGEHCKGRMHLVTLPDRREDIHQHLDLLEPETLARLRGVFAFHGLYQAGHELMRRGIPVVSMASVPPVDIALPVAPAWVHYDLEQAYRLALTHLHGRGQRRVTLLSSASDASDKVDHRWRHVHGIARELGITLRHVHHPTGPITEQMGWQLFRQVRTEQPDCRAILVSDEMLCRGVLRGIAQEGLRMPRDLCLVTRAIAGVPLPHEHPVTRVDDDPAKLVQAAFASMQGIVAGTLKPPAETIVPTSLSPGATT